MRAGAVAINCVPLPAELGLVVGHQPAAGLDQAQREIGFAGARRPAQQHGAPRLPGAGDEVACTSMVFRTATPALRRACECAP